MDKSTVITAQRIIAGFQDMFKRFPSESDFTNQKTDLSVSLLHLADSPVCKELDQITNSITNTRNLLKSLNYDSSYRDLVEFMNGLSEIKYELDEYLDDDE